MLADSNMDGMFNYVSNEDIQSVAELIQKEKPYINAEFTTIFPFCQICFGDRDKAKKQKVQIN